MTLDLPRPSKIVCVAKNYADHAREMGSEIPETPVFFLKPPSALLPGGGTVVLPAASSRVEVECELAAVIGRPCTRLDEAEAASSVVGYAVFFDMTARDLQAEAKRLGLPWTASKGFDTFAPMSAVRPAGDVGDPGRLDLRLSINGEVRQDANSRDMAFPVARLVAEASRIMTLEPGDVLATGTPAGVSVVRPGDRLEGSIERVGTLRCTVSAGNP